MKKDTYNLTIGLNLKTEYKNETTLQAFKSYVKINLMHSQHVLNIKKLNYHSLIRESVKNLINETTGLVDYAVMSSNDVALYLNNEVILVARF